MKIQKQNFCLCINRSQIYLYVCMLICSSSNFGCFFRRIWLPYLNLLTWKLHTKLYSCQFVKFLKTLSIFWANLNRLHQWIQSATTACLTSVNQAKCNCNCNSNWIVCSRPFPNRAEIKHMLGFFRFNANAWDNLILNLRSGNETYWNHAQQCAGYTLESRNED